MNSEYSQAARWRLSGLSLRWRAKAPKRPAWTRSARPTCLTASARCALVMLLAAWTGCARWADPPQSTSPQAAAAVRLQRPPATADTVFLEILTISVPQQGAELSEQAWQEVDEARLPLETRRVWNQNGLRGGLIGQQVPVALHQLIDQDPRDLPPATAPTPGEGNAASRRRSLHAPSGQLQKVFAGKAHPQLSTFTLLDGRVEGDAFTNAQCLFVVRAFSQPDGNATLELRPEIEHGDPRNRRVVKQGTWQFELGRERHVFDSLRLELPVSPGQSLLLGATSELKGIGKAFFGDAETPGDRRLLLIRFAQTQRDDRFRQEPGGERELAW